MDLRFQVLDSGLTLSVEPRLRIPLIVGEISDSLSCIPDSKPRIQGKRINFPASGFQKKNFPDSGIQTPLHGATLLNSNIDNISRALFPLFPHIYFHLCLFVCFFCLATRRLIRER